MTTTLPMLSGEGWLQDPTLIMTRLFSHMFLTDHSQSNVYRGNVTSLQYVLSQHGQNPTELTSEVEKAVKLYYSRYFSNVDVSFTLNDGASEGAKMAFDLHISGSWEGQRYDLQHLLQADNSTGTLQFIQAFDANGELHG